MVYRKQFKINFIYTDTQQFYFIGKITVNNFPQGMERDIERNLKFKLWTRMTTFLKTKFKKSDDQTNIDKYRVAANFKEYNILSKSIFCKIMEVRQLFHVKREHKHTKLRSIIYISLILWYVTRQASLPSPAAHIIPGSI